MENELPNNSEASALSSIRLPPMMLELPMKLPVRLSSIVSSPAAFLTTRPTPSPLEPNVLLLLGDRGVISATSSSGTMLHRGLALYPPNLAGELLLVMAEGPPDVDLRRALARDTSKLSSIVTSAAAARKLASWLKINSCVPVVSRLRVKSESLALGLLDEASNEVRIRDGLLDADEDVGTGESGVDALLSPPLPPSLLPGEEEELNTIGRRKGESPLKCREAAESVDATFEGEVLGELSLLKSDTAVEAPSRTTFFEGEDKILLPEALRGDFEGETGGGILIESNMAARAAFSGDMALVPLGLRSGD